MAVAATARCAARATRERLLTRSASLAHPPRARVGAALRCSSSSTAAGEEGAGASPPPPPPREDSRWYKLREDALDVLSVTFGWTRKRDVERDLDLGLRAYAWVTYVDPATNAPVYRNNDTGAVTGVKPVDFDRRAPPSARLTVDSSSSAVRAYAPTESAWDKTVRALGDTPLIRGLLAAGSAVAASPVGKAATAVRARASDLREDLQEKWETSQHPCVAFLRACREGAAFLAGSVFTSPNELPRLELAASAFTFPTLPSARIASHSHSPLAASIDSSPSVAAAGWSSTPHTQ